ncbi:MAG: hypothetical protein U0V48_06815 [Anaerolineales bacterium]
MRQLNERHYGALQGLNKSEMVRRNTVKAGEDLASGAGDVPPPALELTDERHPNIRVTLR